jgi:signal transduction histidine kinase/CheY-like chemotaxis protein
LKKSDTSKLKIENSTFGSTLKRAAQVLSSNAFFVLMTYLDRDGFDTFYEENEDILKVIKSSDTFKSIITEFKLYGGPQNEPICFNRDLEQELPSRLLQLLRATRMLICPFVIEDVGTGYAIWIWKDGSYISPDELQKADLVAGQIALSIKVHQKEQSSRERGDKLTALLKLSTAIYSSLNFKEVLKNAVKLSTGIIQADGGTIFILDKEDMLLKPLLTIDDRYQEELDSIKLKLGEGISGKVAQSGVGLISNHSENDPRCIQVPGTPVEKESLISVPLTWSNDVIGVITLWSYNGKVFSQEDLEVLAIFARQTADAIENAKLFESLEHAYEELRATQEQLIMAEKLKALGDMAGGVAHDFNNALGAILGHAQLLLKKIENPDLKKELEIIEQVTLKGRRTVQRLQDFTHVSGRTQFGSVDLNHVIRDAIDTTKPAWKDNAQRLGLTINMHINLGLITIIDGSHEELKEAISNVILNSVDALPDGGNIWISTVMEDEKVVLQIKDDGAGMDENTKNKLFFPFFTTKGKKGVGMGLAIVYGILFRHQADIGVESSSGHGAAFTFKFNISRSAAQDTSGRPNVEKLESLSILLVDDDTNLLEVVGDMLDYMGHRCVKADGGKMALKLMTDGQFDMVITDLGMPEVGGWEVAGFCRENCPGTPIILVSGWGAQLDGEEASQRVDAVLPKPFQMDELKETIAKVYSSANRTHRFSSSIIS